MIFVYPHRLVSINTLFPIEEREKRALTHVTRTQWVRIIFVHCICPLDDFGARNYVWMKKINTNKNANLYCFFFFLLYKRASEKTSRINHHLSCLTIDTLLEWRLHPRIVKHWAAPSRDYLPIHRINLFGRKEWCWEKKCKQIHSDIM